MAYYLCIEKENRKYKKLNLALSPVFSRHSRYVNNGIYSLKDIDYFTANFFNELDLKRELFKSGIITLEDILDDIVIVSEHHKRLSILRYGLVYYYDFDFFNPYDISRLKNYILSKASAKCYDQFFLGELVEEYQISRSGNEYICAIRELIKNKNYEIDLHSALEGFIHNKLYEKDHKTNKEVIRYRELHDLAMFCNNYESKMVQEELYPNTVDLDENRKIALTELQKALNPSKKLVLQKEIPGQMSLFGQ